MMDVQKLRPFDFYEVTLLPGPVQETARGAMEYYYAIDNDDILYYVRRDALGIDPPGKALGGWYANWKGHVSLGQWITSFCRMFALTGEERFREKAAYLAEEYWRCFKAAPEKATTPDYHYGFEKELLAFIEYHDYCKVPHALEYVREFVDYGISHMPRNFKFGDNSEEWYTLGESLYKAYLLTGDQKILDFAGLWEYTEFWELFTGGVDPLTRRPDGGWFSEFCHAYSHVNSMNSASMAYTVKGDGKYLDAATKLWDWMIEKQTFATGGYGPEYEHMMPRERMAGALQTRHDHFETQCDTYAVYRLSKYLTSFTGLAKYGDWAELLLYNSTLPMLPMSPEGRIMYYSDYNTSGAERVNCADPWTCCTGTRPLLTLEVQRLIYYHDEEGLYISQYVPSEVCWRPGHHEVRVVQTTLFPEEDYSRFEVKTLNPIELTLHFRIPGWLSDDMTLTVNGQDLRFEIREGWACVRRVWADGDQVVVRTPLAPRVMPFDKEKGGPCALMCGPVALAAKTPGDVNPNTLLDMKTLERDLIPVPGKPLWYTVGDVCFRPYGTFDEHEKYYLYMDAYL